MRAAAFLPLVAAAALGADFPEPPDTEPSPLPRMDAEQSARSMRLPPGFSCAVFAAEPDVRQPIAATFDARGRLWVAENYTYAENPKRWDPALRDRILIFEDKNGDGRFDERKVFWSEGTFLTSIETGFGGVWALCAPNLIFIPDKDGDDVPDGAPEIVLDGWNYKTIGHNIVNGLRWGPDGWLYGRHGITDNSLVGPPGAAPDQRVKMNCAIWRLHPVTRKLEVVCHGGTNSWGHDWDEAGQLFYINTVIGHLWHVIPGGYYRRMFGAHLNQRVYDIIEQTADHFHWDDGGEKWSDLRDKPMSSKTDAAGGGHAHVGAMIYQGDNWPQRYRNQVFTCNLHGHRVNADRLVREGCGFTGKHEPDFMLSQDKWFRGIELLTGPDGGVFVLDWSDAGECHDNDGVHRSSGRVFKIVHDEPRRLAPFDLSKQSDTDLVQWQMHSNAWWSRTARRVLQERAARGDDMTATRRRLRTLIATTEDVPHKLRLVWALHSIGGADEAFLRSLLAEDDENLRVWGVKLLGELPALSRESQGGLVRLAREDASGLVRAFLASHLRNRPAAERWPVAMELAKHAEDAADRQQPLLIWYGIEPVITESPEKALHMVASCFQPKVRQLIARRLTEEIETQPEGVNGLIELITGPRAHEPGLFAADILAGMSAALQGWSRAPKPMGWDEVVAKLAKDKTLEAPIREISAVFGSGRAAEELLAIAKDDQADASARQAALRSLLKNPKPELLPLLRGWTSDKILGVTAITGLASYDDPTVAKALLERFPRFNADCQAAAVNTLVARPSSATALLAAVAAGTVPRSAISPFHARQIHNLGDPSLASRLADTWGAVRDTPEAKKAELARWTSVLTAGILKNADAGKGRALFEQACAACHKLFGQGGAVGPELTGADRGNLHYLLENILDPSATLPNDFRMTVFHLQDGRILTGIIAEQTEKMLTIQTQVERLTLEKAGVKKQEVLPMSLMPEGLLGALSEEQVKQLFAYLMSKQQVAK